MKNKMLNKGCFYSKACDYQYKVINLRHLIYDFGVLRNLFEVGKHPAPTSFILLCQGGVGQKNIFIVCIDKAKERKSEKSVIF
ncbi:MAG: hypothetical protein LUC88_04260 [Prevotella sp.]|nr:hypothetical protein [Prevotella sp.]